MIMDLIPYTLCTLTTLMPLSNFDGFAVGGCSSGSESDSTSKFFFADDVHAVARDFKNFEDDVQKGPPKSRSAFDDFVKSKLELVLHSFIVRAPYLWGTVSHAH